jgi:hypothetical protein
MLPQDIRLSRITGRRPYESASRVEPAVFVVDAGAIEGFIKH